MKRYIIRIATALITLILGIIAADLSRYIQWRGSAADVITLEVTATPPLSMLSSVKEKSRELSPIELEMIESAEYFVAWNGYTDQQRGGVGRIYFEFGENSSDFDALWRTRYQTLEDKAYGLICEKRGASTFWTVVFRYTDHAGKNRENVGRALTVEIDRFNVHRFISFSREFPLSRVEKKL